MNVLEALIGVIRVLLATTLEGVTSALVTLDTLAMVYLAQVGAYTFSWVECLLNLLKSIVTIYCRGKCIYFQFGRVII